MVKWATMIVLGLAGISIAGTSGGSSNGLIDLRHYVWKNRPLLLFAPSPDDPAYVRVQNNIRQRWDELVERDMVLIEAFETGLVRHNGVPLTDKSPQALQRKFNVQPDRLTAILVGKDGGVKYKSTDRFDLQRIFDLIDSMPMRMQEMRDRAD